MKSGLSLAWFGDQGEVGGPHSWETLEVTGVEKMAWSEAAVGVKRPDE